MRLLIVDDEYSSIEAITMLIKRTGLPFEEIRTAENIIDAREICRNETIDILLCDIEMPMGSGLEFLRWISEEKLRIITILFTCHADFTYAKEAIALGCQNYLLKPVDPDELKAELEKAIHTLEETRRLEELAHYREKDAQNRENRFWMEVIYGEIPGNESDMRSWMKKNRVDIPLNIRYCPVLLKVNDWNGYKDIQERQLMSFSMRNVLEELTQFWNFEGYILQFQIDSRVLLISELTENGDLRTCCEDYLKKIEEYFGIQQSAWQGAFVQAADIADEMEYLREQENRMALKTGYHDAHQIEERTLATDLKSYVFEDRMKAWNSMIRKRKLWELREEILQFLKMYGPRMKNDVLREFGYAYLDLVWNYAKLHEIPMNHIFTGNALTVKKQLSEQFSDAVQSLEGMRSFVIFTMDQMRKVQMEDAEEIPVTERVKLFLHQHVSEDLGVEEIASAMNLNADYLGRVFKKETGMSIGKYYTRMKMDHAKELLQDTAIPISEVAARIGYDNYTSFTRSFTRECGMSPQNFRKNREP